jgi:hypothetical protein
MQSDTSADRVAPMEPATLGFFGRGGRLLRQPGGFEGFVSVGVHLHSRDEPIPKRPDLCETHLHHRAAAPRVGVLADNCDDLIVSVDCLLHVERPVLEAFEPLREPPVGFVDADTRLPLHSAPKRARVPDEVGDGPPPRRNSPFLTTCSKPRWSTSRLASDIARSVSRGEGPDLFLKPGGYEGFLVVEVGPDANRLAFFEVGDSADRRLILGAALSAAHADAAKCDDPVAKVANLGVVGVDLDEGLGQISEPVRMPSCPRYTVRFPPSAIRIAECHSTSGSSSSSNASSSWRVTASAPRLNASTFSCDIARPVCRGGRGVAHPPAAAADQTLSEGDTVPEAVRNLRRYGRADRQLLRPR